MALLCNIHLTQWHDSRGMSSWLTVVCTLQFIATLQAAILAKISAVVNVTISKVESGSAIVYNSVAFTSADSAAALADRTALYTDLTAGDVSLFGSSFGTVTVSNVAQANTTNPSKCQSVLFVVPKVTNQNRSSA